MYNILLVIEPNSIPERHQRYIQRYIKEYEEYFHIICADFKQLFCSEYVKEEDVKSYNIEFKVIKLLWFHFCETCDHFNKDNKKAYEYTLTFIDFIINEYKKLDEKNKKRYVIPVTNIFKNINLFPQDITYELTIDFIINIIKFKLNLIYIKFDESNNNNKNIIRERRDSRDRRHNSRDRRDNNISSKRKFENEQDNNSYKKEKTVKTYTNPYDDYYLFISTDANPSVAHKQYLSCIDNTYYYFKTMNRNISQQYFEELMKAEDPDKFHNDIISKVQNIYGNYIRNSTPLTINTSNVSAISSPHSNYSTPTYNYNQTGNNTQNYNYPATQSPYVYQYGHQNQQIQQIQQVQQRTIVTGSAAPIKTITKEVSPLNGLPPMYRYSPTTVNRTVTSPTANIVQNNQNPYLFNLSANPNQKK